MVNPILYHSRVTLRDLTHKFNQEFNFIDLVVHYFMNLTFMDILSLKFKSYNPQFSSMEYN